MYFPSKIYLGSFVGLWLIRNKLDKIWGGKFDILISQNKRSNSSKYLELMYKMTHFQNHFRSFQMLTKYK